MFHSLSWFSIVTKSKISRKQPTITTSTAQAKDSGAVDDADTTDDGSTGGGPPREPTFEAAMDRECIISSSSSFLKHKPGIF